MAFRLKHRRVIGKELSRVVRKEFKSALKELRQNRSTQEAIHEARKSLKKVRAELRLLRDPLGAGYQKENRRLRTAAHLLSSLREADAAVETLDELEHRYRTVVTPSISSGVKRGLRHGKRRVVAHAEVAIGRAVGALKRSRRTLPDEILRVATPATAREGLERGYRRARAAMKTVCMDSDSTQFHLWRRRLKDHRYQVRLFESLHPAARRRARTLRKLERWLGDDHNLSALRALLLATPERFGGAKATSLVLGCIVKYQQSLRRRALSLGHRAFAPKPAEFRQTAVAWW